MKLKDFLMIVFNLFRGNKPYTYERRYKRINKRNPISGHCWSEDVPLNTWDIISPLSGKIQSVRSEEKAIALCNEYGSCNVYIPLVERELEKMREELQSY